MVVSTLRGQHVASTIPYGYLKDKDDSNIWVSDEEAAAVVQRIFHSSRDSEEKRVSWSYSKLQNQKAF